MEAADSLGDLRGVGNGVSSHSQPLESSLTVSTSVTDSMRSSNSSLAKSESSDTTTPSSVLRHPGRATSAHLKKVSICDVVSSPVGKREGQAVSPSGGERGLSHRASLIQVSSCRKARKAGLYIWHLVYPDNDVYPHATVSYLETGRVPISVLISLDHPMFGDV